MFLYIYFWPFKGLSMENSLIRTFLNMCGIIYPVCYNLQVLVLHPVVEANSIDDNMLG